MQIDNNDPAIQKVCRRIGVEKIWISSHAAKRMNGRSILTPTVLAVLKNGNPYVTSNGISVFRFLGYRVIVDSQGKIITLYDRTQHPTTEKLYVCPRNPSDGH